MAFSFCNKLEFLAKIFFGQTEAMGIEHLEAISAGGRTLFATSHISGFDVQLAGLVLCRHLGGVKIVATSDLLEGWSRPLHRIGGALAGKGNLLPIHHAGNGRNKRNFFYSADFDTIKRQVEQAVPVVMAAYLEKQIIWHLPAKGGVGAVYLAQVTSNIKVIPVAVDVLSEKPIAMDGQLIKTALVKPAVRIIIGEPMAFEPIAGIELFSDLVRKNHGNVVLSRQERQTFHSFRNALREQSDLLMVELAKLLPKEKRGQWQDKIQTG